MAISHLAGVGFAIGDEFLHVFGGEFAAHHQDEAGFANFANRCEVFHRVVGQFFIQADVGGLRGAGGDQKGVAITRCAFDGLGTQNAIGPGLVLDGGRLPQRFAHGLRHDAAHGVGRAASREGHHKFDGFVGVSLRHGLHAQASQCNGYGDRCGDAKQQVAKLSQGHGSLRALGMVADLTGCLAVSIGGMLRYKTVKRRQQGLVFGCVALQLGQGRASGLQRRALIGPARLANQIPRRCQVA